jgi:hypothetical protein
MCQASRFQPHPAQSPQLCKQRWNDVERPRTIAAFAGTRAALLRQPLLRAVALYATTKVVESIQVNKSISARPWMTAHDS